MVKKADIENCMGDFSKETNILKKFARKGQCFSTSNFICAMKKDQVTMGLPDIERNDYIFTDGVGYISESLALEAAKKFKFK